MNRALLITAAALLVAVGVSAGMAIARAAPPDDGGETDSAPFAPDRPLTASEVASRDLRSLLKRAFEDLPSIFTSKGTGVISGRVIDEKSGEPLAGIKIIARAKFAGPTPDTSRLYIAGSRLALDIPKDPMTKRQLLDAYADEAARAVEGSLFGGQLLSLAYSGSDGSYSLTGLGDLDYEVEAHQSGARIRALGGSADSSSGRNRPFAGIRSASAVRAKAGGVVDFTAALPAGIRLRVLMPDGSPAEHLTITHAACPKGMENAPLADVIAAVSSSTEARWYGQGDIVELTPGTHVIQAAPRLKEGLAGPAALLVTVGTTNKVAELRLSQLPGVVVKPVQDNTDWDYSVAQIRCIPVSDDFQLDSTSLEQLRRNGLWGTQGMENSVSSLFRLLPRHISFREPLPGRNIVIASIGRHVIAHEYITVKAGEIHNVTLRLPDPKRSDFVEVLVTDEQGRLLTEDVSVDISVDKFFRVSRLERVSGRSAEGAHLLVFPPQEDVRGALPAGESRKPRVRAYHPAYGAIVQEVARTDATVVKLQFQTPASIVIEVKDLAGHPAKAVLIARTELEHAGFSTIGEPEATRPLGVDGPFRLGPVQPGRTVAAMALKGPRGSHMEISQIVIEAKSGENHAMVELPELFQLRVEAKGITADSELEISRLRGNDDMPEKSRPGAYREFGRVTPPRETGDGFVKFPFLPPGRYEVTLRLDDQSERKTREISLEADTTVSFDK